MAAGDSEPRWDAAACFERVADFVVDLAMAELAQPHIVVCLSPGAGGASYSGPYATGLEALIAAEEEADSCAVHAEDERDRFEYRVAPLYPASLPTRRHPL